MLVQCDNYVKKTYPNGACLIKNGAFLPFKRIGGERQAGVIMSTYFVHTFFLK